MPKPTLVEPPRIYPTFRYRDADRMIDWLVEAFGFVVHANYKDDNGVVQHAQLAYGSSMIMIGTARDDAHGARVGGAGQTGGKATYVAVDDADAMFARAEVAGARIEEGLTDRDYGSREFICRDPEGNVWSFGTYWPKAHEPA
ncbi:VOC family protein [Bauldia sp.]|uniref:VOC family protein n=1 Tax=Bauldia sp. TaxID=2575872 RepID=UPI003BA9DB69